MFFYTRFFNTISFQMWGEKLCAQEQVNTTLSSVLQISFSEPSSIEVNYNDGTPPEFFETGSINRIDFSPYTHTYQDGFNGIRSVDFKFKDATKITKIIFFRVTLFNAIDGNIVKALNLEELSLRSINVPSQITSFPQDLSTLLKLKSIRLENIGSALETQIPISILELENLSNINLRGSFILTDVVSSNLNKINLRQNSLKFLDIAGCDVLTLPETFKELTELEALNIEANLFDAPPIEINSLISLKTLTLGDYVIGSPLSNCTSYGDLSNLINLETIRLEYLSSFTTEIPVWFSNLTKLKYLGAFVSGNFNTTTRIDEFINNFYDFISINASKGTGNTPFREMSIGAKNAIPTGTYQEPLNFQMGVSNGNPITPQEKIWVMVKQYAHTWNYNQI